MGGAGGRSLPQPVSMSKSSGTSRMMVRILPHRSRGPTSFLAHKPVHSQALSVGQVCLVRLQVCVERRSEEHPLSPADYLPCDFVLFSIHHSRSTHTQHGTVSGGGGGNSIRERNSGRTRAFQLAVGLGPTSWSTRSARSTRPMHASTTAKCEAVTLAASCPQRPW